MAEPKPAPEKSASDSSAPQKDQPSLSVAPGPRTGAAAQPAKSEPAPSPREGEQAPRSGAPASPAPQAQREPRRGRGTRWALGLLAALLVVAGVTAWVQSERLSASQSRVTALSEQILGLEAQLSAANTQISTYQMERGQVRAAVSDIAERVLLLNELVGGADLIGSPEPVGPESAAAASAQEGTQAAGADASAGASGSEASSAPASGTRAEASTAAGDLDEAGPVATGEGQAAPEASIRP